MLHGSGRRRGRLGGWGGCGIGACARRRRRGGGSSSGGGGGGGGGEKRQARRREGWGRRRWMQLMRGAGIDAPGQSSEGIRDEGACTERARRTITTRQPLLGARGPRKLCDEGASHEGRQRRRRRRLVLVLVRVRGWCFHEATQCRCCQGGVGRARRGGEREFGGRYGAPAGCAHTPWAAQHAPESVYTHARRVELAVLHSSPALRSAVWFCPSPKCYYTTAITTTSSNTHCSNTNLPAACRQGCFKGQAERALSVRHCTSGGSASDFGQRPAQLLLKIMRSSCLIRRRQCRSACPRPQRPGSAVAFAAVNTLPPWPSPATRRARYTKLD